MRKRSGNRGRVGGKKRWRAGAGDLRFTKKGESFHA